MIDTEKWIQWHPLEALPARFLIKSFQDLQEKLEFVFLVDCDFDKRSLRIEFQEKVLFYKKIHEYCAIKDTMSLQKLHGDDFVTSSALFIITNSQYAELLTKSSSGLRFIHYVILGTSSRVDVVTAKKPLVEWVEHVV